MSPNEANGGGWLMDYGLLDDFPAADYIWSPQFLHDPAASRARVESSAAPRTKACREKLRRDRLNDRYNDRFTTCVYLTADGSMVRCHERGGQVQRIVLCVGSREASSQGRQACRSERRHSSSNPIACWSKEAEGVERSTARCDKESKGKAFLYLSLSRLSAVVRKVRIGWQAEKSELRDEKTRLRCEKEQMEKVLRGISFTPPFTGQSAAPAAALPATNDKTFAYMPICMWQWVPPAALDTSQDHVLRPPVA
ncbi:hypothetical protein BHE74_00005631 [Ensete ventricosum]|nr:hypothetical protein GW17_00012253 [Ensete ventricosum]RWW85673.1 hypothetical protein BHE74_00005631 [Ensete ventricosum]RZS10036.1 hypothetical protein BHM03_00041172 [Ensete ventricosum]